MPRPRERLEISLRSVFSPKSARKDGQNDSSTGCEHLAGRVGYDDEHSHDPPAREIALRFVDDSSTGQKLLPTIDSSTPAPGELSPSWIATRPQSNEAEGSAGYGNANPLLDNALHPSLPEAFRASAEEQYAEGIPAHLCARCRLVRWSAFAESSPHYYVFGGLPIFHESGSKGEDLRCSTCSLCQFYPGTSNWTAFSANPLLREYKVKAHGPRKSMVVFSCDSEILMGIQHANSSQDTLSPFVLSPNAIDFTVLQGWLSLCQEKHAGTCHAERSENVLGFKVIDCRLKCVVQAPDRCKYTALSYVWGRTASHNSHVLDDSAPATIQDSIAVTLNMGFRYLWIDRYCIDQNNPVDQHDQIRNMHRIYSEAEVTFIAAAGEDPTYGLPGVSIRSRTPQRYVQIGDINLVQIFPNIDVEIRRSAWNKRAWTYQEAVFAKRKILFTDRQVSFLCRDMLCVETIRQKLLPGIKPGLDARALNTALPDNHPDNPMSILHQYTSRTLSYDSDALNACLAVLNSLNGWNHVWGVPFGNKITKVLTKNTSSSESVRGNRRFLLYWYHYRPARRRKDFPSWSWAGWDGPIHICHPFVDYKCEFKIQGTDYYTIAMHNGVKTGLPASHIPDTEASKILEITSYAFPIQLLRAGDVSLLGNLYAITPVSEDVFGLFITKMDEDSGITDAYALAFNWFEGSSRSILSALVVKEVDEGLYARIGVIHNRGFVNANGDELNVYRLGSYWPMQAKWATFPIK